jgi:hypothetical protein
LRRTEVSGSHVDLLVPLAQQVDRNLPFPVCHRAWRERGLARGVGHGWPRTRVACLLGGGNNGPSTPYVCRRSVRGRAAPRCNKSLSVGQALKGPPGAPALLRAAWRGRGRYSKGSDALGTPRLCFKSLYMAEFWIIHTHTHTHYCTRTRAHACIRYQLQARKRRFRGAPPAATPGACPAQPRPACAPPRAARAGGSAQRKSP